MTTTMDHAQGIEWDSWRTGGCNGRGTGIYRQGVEIDAWPRVVIAEQYATADVMLAGMSNIRDVRATRTLFDNDGYVRGFVPIQPFLPDAGW